MDTGAILDMFYPHARCRCDLALKMIYPVARRGWHLTFFGGMKERASCSVRECEPGPTPTYVRARHDVMRYATRFCESLKYDGVQKVTEKRQSVSDQRSRSLGTVIQGCSTLCVGFDPWFLPYFLIH